MMRSRRSRWRSGIGAAVLVGGLVLTNSGGGVTPAAAAPPPDNPGVPFQEILDKLDQVLAALTGTAGQNNHTLRWDTNNPSGSRFTTAFPGAVLDKNTGLVWEQAPDATTPPTRNWAAAIRYCLNKDVGGTAGWRLPSVVELRSVQDASPGAVAPFVPANVFTGVQSDSYWSATATTDTTFPIFGWHVNFFDNGNAVGNSTTPFFFVWCVRGPMQESAY
jgi:hypothetical protein